ncbi:MAG: hypothetical protein K6G12_08405 [Lachnospiraceae bacterium]|nr:hypothetical protein [Lachnospiraceae bacterium]
MALKIKNYIRDNWFACISGLILLGAFFVVCLISFWSEYGVHPDEWDVRLCMDWCMDHFIWPDMRLKGEGLGDTYSGYGYTKVCNYTPYFLIFSKISYVFKQFMDVLPYYRMPNLLLMLVIMVYMFKNIRTKNYLMLAFGICVQAWYIFSYVTADAEDFLLGFFAIALLTDEDGFLWKIIEPDNKRNIPGCVGLGLLYGILMLGKPYYYATLVLTFIVLVSHLIKSEINKHKEILIRYFIIAGVAFAVFAGRAAIDLHYYGFDKADAKLQMEAEYADYDKNPTTPAEDIEPGWRMQSRGHNLSYLFEEVEPHWFWKTYVSFACARVFNEGNVLYFVVMGILYIFILARIGISLYREKNFGVFWLGMGMSVLGILASVLFSWLRDVQPQGRYLLPILFNVCYMGSRAKSLWDDKVFKGVVLAAGCLSVAYFGLVDARKLIDLSYVRSILG